MIARQLYIPTLGTVRRAPSRPRHARSCKETGIQAAGDEIGMTEDALVQRNGGLNPIHHKHIQRPQHPPNEPAGFNRRSVSRSSSPPASEVIVPPSNCARTVREKWPVAPL